MKGKNPLDTDSKRNLSHRKGRLTGMPLPGNHNSLKELDPLLLPLLDLAMDTNRIPGTEFGKLSEAFLANFLHEIHKGGLSSESFLKKQEVITTRNTRSLDPD